VKIASNAAAFRLINVKISAFSVVLEDANAVTGPAAPFMNPLASAPDSISLDYPESAKTGD